MRCLINLPRVIVGPLDSAPRIERWLVARVPARVQPFAGAGLYDPTGLTLHRWSIPDRVAIGSGDGELAIVIRYWASTSDATQRLSRSMLEDSLPKQSNPASYR